MTLPNSSAPQNRSYSAVNPATSTSEDEAHKLGNLERLREIARDIFFSPIAVSNSEIALSDPLPTPPETVTTPTQVSSNASVSREGSQTPESTVSVRPKLRLTTQSFERLVRAYLSAPLFRDAVCRQRGGGDSAECESVTRIAQKNADDGPLHPKIRGIVVTESRLKGNPVRFMTNGYRDLVGNMLNVRSQSFLDSPFGNEFERDCCFRVESRSNGDGCRVSICVIHDVIDRVDGRNIFHLVNDVDVSEPVSAAVLAEMAAKAEIDIGDIEITNTLFTDRSCGKSSTASDDDSSSVDWLQLADELQIEYELDSIVDLACEILTELELTNCSSQTQDLVGHLERLKHEYRDFVILQTRKFHAPPPNAVPSKIGVPWISDHFEWKLHDGERIPETARRHFRDNVVGIVAKKAAEQIPFASACKLGEADVRLQCAPLRGKTPFSGFDAWVVFVNSRA